MDEPNTLLEELLEAWSFTRHGAIDELDAIPDDRWDERVSPRARSIAELARHLLEGANLMIGELTDPAGDFGRASPPEIVAEHSADLPETATPDEWKRRLREQLEDGTRRFRAAGEVAMLQRIRRFDGAYGTRLAWMHHGIAHEEYHRGQIALTARAMGLVPALTRLIYGDDAV